MSEHDGITELSLEDIEAVSGGDGKSIGETIAGAVHTLVTYAEYAVAVVGYLMSPV